MSLKNCSFAWNSSAGENGVSVNLVDINLDVQQGELIGIVGRVGSGKSSLLSAILGILFIALVYYGINYWLNVNCWVLVVSAPKLSKA